MQHVTKLCADHLRAFTSNSYNIKLRASHAHELVAAFFGYQSKAALLADTKYPLTNLHQASIIVLSPTAPIDQRRKSLQDLPSGLPDTYTLAEEVYSGLITEKWLLKKPWPAYELLAISLADEYLRQHNMEKVYRVPLRESVKVEPEQDRMILIVLRFYQIPRIEGGVHEVDIVTTIKLPRVAGHIGYANPEVHGEVGRVSGGSRITFIP